MRISFILSAMLVAAVMVGPTPSISAGPLDGVYAGATTLTRANGRLCKGSVKLVMTVTGGNATALDDETYTFTGTVQPDGAFSLSGKVGDVGRAATITGKIAARQATGQVDSGACLHTFTLTKN